VVAEKNYTLLFESHYPKVLRLCKGYFNGDEDQAADAAQEVFIKVWEHLERFKNQSSISTWIFRIAVNTCLMHLRKKKNSRLITTDQFPNLANETYATEKEEQLQKMYTCIQKLDETGKMIILMVLEDLPYEEIAQVVGISEETLRVRIHRIKKSLTQCVQL